jgi:hypothetical protein
VHAEARRNLIKNLVVAHQRCNGYNSAEVGFSEGLVAFVRAL